MRTDKEQAFALRRSGKSYKEIHSSLGMSVSTLSNWFHGQDFSEAIKKSLTNEAIAVSSVRLRKLNKIRGDSLAALYEQAKREAVSELDRYKNDPLFISAIVAYWGEGDKVTTGLVRLANTDPAMIKLFMLFLTRICKAPPEKIKGALYIYPNLDEYECKRYWSDQTGLVHFHKTMILPSRHKTKRLPYGTCTVLIANTYLKKKMLVWIDQLPQMVLNIDPEANK
ncbi:MAG: hypothetical protein ACI9VM_000632 [Candidatus Azotimanducaceae bacterium]|jgi:hypothetical protein